ncbi:rod shape-determining protein MreC [Helicovermis profundi]|uniref:Cell shape-determining protein MreC n=1 Tax=Helicovermis profundi TaxID=3065157 RepID=A0AAU9EK22_9FIRM|nr:rod shape-determining protein MreC [Clostridia bacterium S502]
MNEYSKWKKWFIIILGIILLFFMGISAGGRSRISIFENIAGVIITPIQKVLYTSSEYISSKVNPILNVWKTMDENKMLLEENSKMKEELIKVTLDKKEYGELKDLSKTLNYINKTKIDNFVSANITAKDSGNWYNMFTIDVGENDGVTKNSTVINGKGLVGLVYDVGSNWSKVVTIIDNKSSIGFESLKVKSSFDGILSGTYNYNLIGNLFDPKAKVEFGDKIITSGLGIYPKGILIGYVDKINTNKDNLLIEVKVKPTVNFKKINKVIVLPYDKERTYDEK